ncbi:MAG: T9SS type A sorting domain-containing protein [Bacteroidia bacterium]|nr:T9SS type A sorting domain-containing protein [Bacteroidia bacterium]MCF8448099.1 T9SS type A sorting domain-containing protein [Bacteroidia bacterium]
MKKALLIIAVVFAGMAAQAQIKYGFNNPLSYDNWNNNDPDAGVEIVVWTPNNDTLRMDVGSDVTAIDGSARNGIEYNFTPKKCIFGDGTNIYDESNRRVFSYNLPPNTTFFGTHDFYIKLTNPVGILASDFLNERDLMHVIIDYDGTNVGIGKLDVHSYRLYPIPTSSRLFIEGANPTVFKVYDLSGRLVKEGDVMQNSIDVSDLNNGLYVLYAMAENGLIVQKFLKQ